MKRLRTLWAEFRAFAFKGNMIDLAVAVVIGAAFSGVIKSLVNDIIMPTVSYAVSAVKEAKERTAHAVDAAGHFTGLTTQPSTAPTTEPTTEPTTAPSTQPAQPGDAASQVLASAAADHKSKEWQDMASAFTAALAADRQAAEAKAAREKAEADRKAAAEKPVDLSWKIGRINIGGFIGALINFVIIAMAVFLVIVKVLGGVMKRAGGTPAPEGPTTKECPECLSVIPIKARRCPNCTSVLPVDPTPTV